MRQGISPGSDYARPARRRRLTRGSCQRRLKIQASWPWAADIITAWNRVSALPQAP